MLTSLFYRELQKLTSQNSSDMLSNVGDPDCTATSDSDPSCFSDADLLYVVLCQEQHNYMLCSSESEEEASHEDDPGVLEMNNGSSLQEILSQLACAINEDKISKFNISCSHLWEGALKDQYPVTAHVPNFDFLTGCREFKRCEK